MTEAFVFTETDRTKSKWIARVYQDFIKNARRSRTTLRGLFYHALQMKSSDYPICGGFVGEIRITRPFQESDGEKLLKWMRKSRELGFISADAILEEPIDATEQIFLPEIVANRPYSLEVWVNKSALNPLLYPVCQKYGAALVSVRGRASDYAISALLRRCNQPIIILSLSDLSPSGALFCQDLAEKIEKSEPLDCKDIKIRSIGLKPKQVRDLNLPLIEPKKGMASREEQNRFKEYVKNCEINPRKIAELDSLEAHYPGGIAGFLDISLSSFISDPNFARKKAIGSD